MTETRERRINEYDPADLLTERICDRRDEQTRIAVSHEDNKFISC